MAEAIAATGARVVDGDWMVDRVRLVKSPAELERVRRAAEIVDAAFAALPGEVRPGMTELQIASRLDGLMAEPGGEPRGDPDDGLGRAGRLGRTHGAPGAAAGRAR